MWTKIDPATTPLFRYSGDFPEYLYRYRPISLGTIDRRFDELLNEEIYLEGFGKLNDPDEGRFLLLFEGTREEIAQSVLIALNRQSPGISRRERKRFAYLRADEIIAAGRRPPIEMVQHMRHMIENLGRVACFTTLPINYSMWANYAKYSDEAGKNTDHGGICIEYKCDESWRTLNLGPVMYSNEIPIINPVRRNEGDLGKL